MLFMLCLTFAFGAFLYFVNVWRGIVIGTTIVSAGIVLSFVLLVGEVYVYSDTYRRAFFIFGDEVTTVLSFSFLYSFAARKKWLSILTLTAILMSGGRVSLILLLIMMTAFLLIQKHGKDRFVEAARLSWILLLCVLIYSASIQASLRLMEHPVFLRLHDGVMQLIAREYSPPEHRTACHDLSLTSCVEEQSNRAILQRYYTSLGGLWMTLEGGYSGRNYPNSATQFADLMVAANPWGMNDRYGLTRMDWTKMGAVHNAYLNFGSRYGPWLLLGLVGIVMVIGFGAWRSLARGESDTTAIFAIWFMAITLFNQTQPWLLGRSWILVLLGLCTCHIVVTWFSPGNLVRRACYGSDASVANDKYVGININDRRLPKSAQSRNGSTA